MHWILFWRCNFTIFQGYNDWRIVKLVQSDKDDEGDNPSTNDLHQTRVDVLMNLTEQCVNDVRRRKFGAVSVNDTENFYIFQWINDPYKTDKEMVWEDNEGDSIVVKKGEWIADIKWWELAKGTSKWYYQSKDTETIQMKHVLMADVEMIPCKRKSELPSSCKKDDLYKLKPKMVSEKSLNFILCERARRDAIDHMDRFDIYEEDDNNELETDIEETDSDDD